jgi:hypothetical protein
MRIRSVVLATSLTLIALALPVLAQPVSGAKPWKPPLTADGHPDLQGTWVNRNATPLERPKQLEGRPLLTDAEVAELKSRAQRIFDDGHSDMPGGDDEFLAALANVPQYTRSAATSPSDIRIIKEFDNHTSLIVDPPDGKLPAYTPAGERRRAALAAANNRKGPATRFEDLTTFERCITWGVPMPRPGPFTSYYQIVQSPNYVMFLMEAVHDARVIPLDGRPHLPEAVRGWNGDSRGHWDGQTLVVDTTNFSAETNFMGSAGNLHLTERFTRTAPDEIRYEITVDDATTWTKPWTAVLRLKNTQDKIYELACHEGNFEIMEDMLKAK